MDIRILTKLGIRVRVVVLVILAMLPLLGLISAFVISQRETALRGVSEKAIEGANLASVQQGRVLDEARMLLTMLRSTPELASGGETCLARVRQLSSIFPQFNTLGIATADGTIFCHNLSDSIRELGDMPFLKKVMSRNSPDFMVSNYRAMRSTGKPTIGTAMAVHNGDGELTGVVFASLNLEVFSQLADKLSDDSQRSVAVIEPTSGITLAHSGGNLHLVGQRFPITMLVEEMRAHPQGGIVHTYGLTGRDEIIAFTPLHGAESSGAMVAVGIDRAAGMANADWFASVSTFIAISALLLAVTTAWLVGYWTNVRPIRLLAKTAKRFGDGDLTAKTKLEAWQAPEFHALGSTLDKMAEQISAARDAVQESEKRYRWLADQSADIIFKLDRNFLRTYVSPASLEILGYEPHELVGKSPFELVHPQDLPLIRRTYAELLHSVDRAEEVKRIKHKNGHWVWVESELRALINEKTGERVGIGGSMRDITERKTFEDSLAESESRYRLLAENSADLVTRLDADGRRLFVSDACFDLLGYMQAELIGRSPIELAHPDDAAALKGMIDALQAGGKAQEVQYRARKKDGAIVWMEASGKSLGDGDGIMLSVRDISRRKKAEDELAAANKELERLATVDGLTGLHNRRSFDTSLEREFSRCARENEPISVVLVDVDRFKNYNDTYGHPAGDECLRWLSRALEAAVHRPGDVAARYGGEELALVLPNTPIEGAMLVAEAFRSSVEALRMTHIGSSAGVVTISAGVASINPKADRIKAIDLIKYADEALYHAKGSGRNRVCAYAAKNSKVLRIAS